MDTHTVNHIAGWSLVKSGMSGEAFSTALRHAGRLSLGEALNGFFGYDLSGRVLESEDEHDPALALMVEVERVRS